MKILCKDALPMQDGSYDTDVGYLDFHRKDHGWHTGPVWTISNMLIQEWPKWYEDKQTENMLGVKEYLEGEDNPINEKRRVIRGNLLLSNYLFGPSKETVPLFIQIGYTNGGHKLYRRLDDLGNSAQTNFHNSFDILAPVVCKIAKDYYKCDAFSPEEVRCEEIKDALFEHAYDPMIAWERAVEYVKFKNNKDVWDKEVKK